MKVGLVVYGSIESLSGGYLYDRKLAEHIVNKGDEVRIFSQENAGLAGKLADNFDGVFIRRILDYSPDILIEDELNHLSLFAMNRTLKKKGGFPLISVVHHLRSSEDAGGAAKTFNEFAERLYLRSVDGFVFNSYHTCNSAEKIAGRNDNYVVAYPGKDRFGYAISREELGRKIKNEILKILFVGNIIRRKGLDVLIKALSGINSDKWTLDVVGDQASDPEYFREIKDEIGTLGIADNVIFSDKISDDCLGARLRESNILAVPSCYEGFGIVYLEAMSAGMAVIAGESGGGREIISDCKNGFLVRAGNYRKIMQDIEILGENRNLLYRMGINALETYEFFPGWDESMEKIYLFLKRQLSPKKMHANGV